jgi:solute carrier family 50 protein (sugar transporter)
MTMTLLLNILSFTAVTSTIGLFFCGIPICRNIHRKRSSTGTNPAPFLLGALGGFFWLRYGLLKWDLAVLSVNIIGVTTQLSYLLCFYLYTPHKTSIHCWLTLIGACALGMLVYVHMNLSTPELALAHLGIMCMILNVLNFGAPLAGLRRVVRDRSCESLPLPLCVANLLVSGQWFFYGFLVGDHNIQLPNAIGICLAILPLSLFAIYPRECYLYVKMRLG